MIVFSSGGTESQGSRTFTDGIQAWMFLNKKRFNGFKVKTIRNNTYGTEIVFYSR